MIGFALVSVLKYYFDKKDTIYDLYVTHADKSAINVAGLWIETDIINWWEADYGSSKWVLVSGIATWGEDY